MLQLSATGATVHVCVSLLPIFTQFPRESGLRTALHRCDHHASDSLLHWRLCEQSWAHIPCQFQAFLRQGRLLVVCTVISNWEAVPD